MCLVDGLGEALGLERLNEGRRDNHCPTEMVWLVWDDEGNRGSALSITASDSTWGDGVLVSA